jgi:hypothetical protein
MNKEQVDKCTILRAVVGSTVYGINIGDGQEDRDEMGVCIEPIEEAMGRSVKQHSGLALNSGF